MLQHLDVSSSSTSQPFGIIVNPSPDVHVTVDFHRLHADVDPIPAERQLGLLLVVDTSGAFEFTSAKRHMRQFL